MVATATRVVFALALAVALAMSGACWASRADLTSHMVSWEPATPGPVKIVYVHVYGVSDNWRVNEAIEIVDRYTGSDMRRGHCRTGYKCIAIYEGVKMSSAAGITYGASASPSPNQRVRIYLNPDRERSYSSTTLRRIVAHELGHANGVTWESPSCNIMHRNVFCGGKTLPPMTFRADAVRRLAAN